MAVKKAADTVAEPVNKSSVSVYVGPSILGAIQTMTVYPCSVAESLKRDDVKLATGKYPVVADLIVPAESALESIKQTKTKGSKLYRAYKAVTKNGGK